MVGPRGFEPPTYWSQTSRATKLRYGPTSEELSKVGRLLEGLSTWLSLYLLGGGAR